jgi:hypothetical protein
VLQEDEDYTFSWIVQYDDASKGKSWKDLTGATVTQSSLQFTYESTIANLLPGTTYLFRVVAKNKYGLSKPSSSCYGQTIGAPRQPEAPSSSNLTPTTVTLSWKDKEGAQADPDDPVTYALEMSEVSL